VRAFPTNGCECKRKDKTCDRNNYTSKKSSCFPSSLVIRYFIPRNMSTPPRLRENARSSGAR